VSTSKRRMSQERGEELGELWWNFVSIYEKRRMDFVEVFLRMEKKETGRMMEGEIQQIYIASTYFITMYSLVQLLYTNKTIF
jgi:hypothetical protein